MGTGETTTKTKTALPPRCKEKACTVATDGQCYEGMEDPKSCVNYLVAEETILDASEDIEENEVSEEEAVESLPPTIDLHGGMELEYLSSLRITLSALTRVIVLAGPNDSGKTTLLTSIYEHFLKEPLAGYLFAGSETLRAFEYRCHLSRAESQRDTEDTERTKSNSEQTMLHLCVRDSSLKKKAEQILLSDIRGELFVQAMNSKADCERIKILKRADHVCIVVDGAKVADLSCRNQASIAAKQTIRSFVESDMIRADTRIDVIFTKDDLIKLTDEQFKTTEFLKEIENDIVQKYEAKVRRIRFLRIAARPGKGLHSFGLAELFKTWVEEYAFDHEKPRQLPREVCSDREFDKFAAVQLPTKFVERRQ